MSRTARIERTTKESSVVVELDLDGTGKAEISTGVGFYDHMLNALSKHSLIDLAVTATGDLHIDAHHTVEDVAIVIGEALKIALGDKAGIRRFGDATVPLDEALVHAVVDVSGRPYCVQTGEPEGQQYVVIGDRYIGSLTRHVLESIAHHASIGLHVRVLGGRDPHHIVEAQFKALARALRVAVEPDPRVTGIPSTKGSL
ncbi:imidazoleglycerol-phosphate dehydratase HisB [Kineosporia sp. NBRC 101731]|uniref:imidazoleglycerol-phosphate dehydratase HisB n=1 Tax=Kineosporia sp. NBRC 101731 TaxID=3032199 RepID=UPI0024A2E0D3|nr:imidazoleglycerol-phosphate dehydratase HisB [Kineosporia sp. NBRC 101731]GLY33726.1 imidazoleglycerol-phosphate dehydratase [Kineosporia sp. NBRC 101731]